MMRRSRGQQRRRGVALLGATVFVCVVGTLLLAMTNVALQSGKTVDAGVADRKAYYLAVSAVHEAVASIDHGGSGVLGSREDPVRLGDGLFWTSVEDDGSVKRVTATAMCGSGRSSLEGVVSSGSVVEPYFQAMILSQQSLSIDSNQVFDSYDSSLGTYASQAVNSAFGVTYANPLGSVASNANIVVSSNTKIFGNANPGPSGSISLDSGVKVTGSTTSAPKPFSMPTIDVPPLTSSGNLNVSGSKTLASGSYCYGTLGVKSSTLTIQGPAEVVVSTLNVGENGKLVIDATNGPVTFYVTSSFKWNEKAKITSLTGSPADVAFLVTSTNSITFPGGIDFMGGIYAPNAAVSIDSNSEFWGALVCKKITMSSGTKFHFDEYLLNRTKEGGGGGETQLLFTGLAASTDPTLLADRHDPFEVLGVQRDALRTPGQAWE